MATVRISQDLIGSVKRNAITLFNDRIDRIKQSDPWTNDVQFELMEFALQATFEQPKLMELYNKLPKNAVTKCETLVVKRWGVLNMDATGMDWRVKRPNSDKFHAYAVTEEEAQRLQLGFIARKEGYSSATDVHIRTAPPDAVRDILEKREKWYAALRAVSDEQTAFVRGVETLLKSHTTLSPCLKKWPALWDLLPEQTKLKHKEKVVRTPAPTQEEGVPGVDLNSLTSVVARNKILGGK